jgi:hypothetical protein
MSSSSMMMPPLPKSHGLTPNFMHMGIDFGKFESPSGVLGSMLDMDSPDNIGFSPFIMSYSSPSVKSGTLQTLNIHGIEANLFFWSLRICRTLQFVQFCWIYVRPDA